VNDTFDTLQALVADLGLATDGAPERRLNAAGLASAWLTLRDPADLPRFAQALVAAGGRLATTTVYRPDAAGAPHTHELAYHLLLGGMPVTVKLRLAQGEGVPSIARLFPNADWEEREMMELGGVRIVDHPNPRRMFLDETIEAGVFDRFVPFSEFTNASEHQAVWKRIKARAAGNGEGSR